MIEAGVQKFIFFSVHGVFCAVGDEGRVLLIVMASERYGMTWHDVTYMQ